MNTKFVTNLGLLILRLSVSLSIMTHGYPKFLKLVAGNMSFPDPLGVGEPTSMILAVIGEFVAPIFIAIGLKTRLAAVPAAITLGVAAFVVHGDDPFSKQELAFLYCAAFTAIALLGGGKFSVDGIMKRA